MDKNLYIHVLGLGTGLTYLVSTYKTSWAGDHPSQLYIATLGTSAVLLLLLSRIPPQLSGLSRRGETSFVDEASASAKNTPLLSDTQLASRLQFHFVVFTLVVALCGRVELTRHLLNNTQCARYNLSPLLPFVLVLRERWNGLQKPDQDLGSVFRTSLSRIRNTISQQHWMSLASAGLLCYTSLMITNHLELRSTWICARTLRHHDIIPILQSGKLCLDSVIVLLVRAMLFRGSSDPYPSRRSATFLGLVMLTSAGVLSFVILGMSWWPTGYQYLVGTPDPVHWSDTLGVALGTGVVLISIFCLCLRFGAVVTAIVVSAACTYIIGIKAALDHRHTYPASSTIFLTYTGLAFVGFLFFMQDDSQFPPLSTGRVRQYSNCLSKRLVIMCIALFVGQAILWSTSTSFPKNEHPIETLVSEAQVRHQAWKKQAGRSRSLQEAVESYQARYQRNPPPKFDRWYNYAMLQGSIIIDDFDSIDRDLAPYWALPPDGLRKRTWEAISNPWNDLGGIMIRDARAEISANVPGSHRWMLEGVVNMINNFVKWLPDMDLAFNLNDESRVIAPSQPPQILKRDGEPARLGNRRDFSALRGKQWEPLPAEPLHDTRFQERSWHRTFTEFGIAGCSESSKARRERRWDLSAFCASCFAPHSYSQFVKNWTLAADPCHQPDLGDLQGFYLSPSAFKVSIDLVPVFSQSRAGGFHDILYPSAWNYEDKAVYRPNDEFPDPPFAGKETTLFWRGATTEGVSPGSGEWRGMTRQRLVHLFTNGSDADSQAVLLPTSNSANPSYSIRSVRTSRLRSHLSTSLRFVDHIERCVGRDCSDQHAEFAPQFVRGSDFQEHWRYKYLFDADGAGFSGRFLPFLHSGSLPFKVGVMREWWQDRVTPWVHFVPVDVRLKEAWSLLVYFAGWKGRDGATPEDRNRTYADWAMPPHESEAEAIALRGKEWAEKVLRKEDMEVYLFRLLLEWGRLTDDARDELGFQLDE